MLHGGVGVDGREAAVVVGEDQTVGADDNSRAVAAEVDDIIAQCVGSTVETVLTQLEAFGPHLLIDGLGEVVERPHTFVGLRLTAHGEQRCGEKK